MGIAYLGIGVGGAIVPLVSAALTARFGWRTSLALVGVPVVVIAFPLAYAVRDERATAGGSDSADADRRREPQDSAALGALLTAPAFYLLAIGSMCSIAAVGGTNQHLKLFLSLDRGYAQGEAARIISLVLTVSIAGRLLMGWLADRLPRKFVMLAIYVLV